MANPQSGGAVVDLSGERAVVTGGGRGIGGAAALLLGRGGAGGAGGYRRRKAGAGERGKPGEPGGRIVLVASTAGQRGEPFHADYAATKGAVIALTKSLAGELAPRIAVNCVAPGWVDTEMCEKPFAREAGSGKREIERAIPLGRVATPEEIAGPIVFLCSDLARHITGEILNVNGA